MDGKLRLHVIFRWTDLGMRVETAQPLAIGKWQHVVVSYDGGMRAAGVRMYVDGKQQELKVLFDQLLWPIDTKEPWRIGAGGGLRFQGDIEDVRVYNRALTAAEAGVLPLTREHRSARRHHAQNHAALRNRTSFDSASSNDRARSSQQSA